MIPVLITMKGLSCINIIITIIYERTYTVTNNATIHIQESKAVTKLLAVQLTRIIATWENLSYVWQMYDSPVSSRRIFCKINVATYNQKPQKS